MAALATMELAVLKAVAAHAGTSPTPSHFMLQKASLIRLFFVSAVMEVLRRTKKSKANRAIQAGVNIQGKQMMSCLLLL